MAQCPPPNYAPVCALFSEMTDICNICATTPVQQYVYASIYLCAVNLCVCVVFESYVRAHSLEGALILGIWL